jgi:hypothetical protein
LLRDGHRAYVLLPTKEHLPVPTIEAEYTFSFRTAKDAQSFSYWLFQNGCNKSLWGCTVSVTVRGHGDHTLVTSEAFDRGATTEKSQIWDDKD